MIRRFDVMPGQKAVWGRLLLATLLLVGIFPLASGPQNPARTRGPAGTTATLLPDGSRLLLGGEGPSGPLGDASLTSAEGDRNTPLPIGLLYPRAWHTSTLLPDGTVLILGGVGAGGEIVSTAELFDPQKQTFEPLNSSLTPRAHHSATLVTDGSVLVAGEVSRQRETLSEAELWDPRTRSSKPAPNRLLTPRSGHSAVLLPNGMVALSGGNGSDGVAVSEGERFNPWTQGFERDLSGSAANPGLFLEQSLPGDRATEVPLNSLIALRFSKPLRVQTVNAATVTLTDLNRQSVLSKVTPAENGMLAFLAPAYPFLPGVTYAVAVDGPADATGAPVPFAQFSFTTANADAPSDQTNGGDSQSPDFGRFFQTLQAPPGITALSGRVLELDGSPLPNVPVKIGSKTSRTDALGRFLLTPPADTGRRLDLLVQLHAGQERQNHPDQRDRSFRDGAGCDLRRQRL